jgi:hypothetical protein
VTLNEATVFGNAGFRGVQSGRGNVQSQQHAEENSRPEMA